MIFRTDIAESLKYGAKAAFLEGRNLWTPTRELIANSADSTGKDADYQVDRAEYPRVLAGDCEDEELPY